jgi:hypothetical protein
MPDDELLKLVRKAEMTIYELHVATHYVVCEESAVGELPKCHDKPHPGGDERRSGHHAPRYISRLVWCRVVTVPVPNCLNQRIM